MTKDYYKILGVTEFDNTDCIKQAYRKLARKYHPDVSGDSAEALLRFKEINEAYEILSNRVKKEEYDRARRFYNYAQSNKSAQTSYTKASNPNTKTETKKYNFNWEEFLSKKYKENNFKNTQSKTPIKGDDIHTDLEITVFEALSGVTKTINMLRTQSCPKCQGRKFANGQTCPHCSGTGIKSEYKKFTVKIPQEIKNQSKIRLAGEGNQGINGGKNGDLYITVHIKDNPEYKTEGLNIYKILPISPFEAVLGANIKFNTINGNFSIKLAPNTQNGQKIRLNKCGLVQNDKIGDMILTVEIKIPRNLTSEEINLYKKLEEISSYNVRENQ